MTTKAQVMDQIAAMPDNFNWDSVMYSLKLQESLARADADIEAGRVYQGEDARERVFHHLKERYGYDMDR